MAVGNTFGATALSSYGGFWIAYGILLTPNWNILGKGGPYDGTTLAAAGADPKMGDSAVGFFLTGWFIFTTILLLCTLRSTVMFFLLFFTLDMAFLMLACGEYATDNGAAKSATMLAKAGGGFGMLAAFLAWYNAFAGIADSRSVHPLSVLLLFLHSVTLFPLIVHARSEIVPMEAVSGPPCGRFAICQAAKSFGGVSHLRQWTDQLAPFSTRNSRAFFFTRL
jgi:succinate-acetate transporter protein